MAMSASRPQKSPLEMAVPPLNPSTVFRRFRGIPVDVLEEGGYVEPVLAR